jgi:hypothetical protein
MSPIANKVQPLGVDGNAGNGRSGEPPLDSRAPARVQPLGARCPQPGRMGGLRGSCRGGEPGRGGHAPREQPAGLGGGVEQRERRVAGACRTHAIRGVPGHADHVRDAAQPAAGAHGQRPRPQRHLGGRARGRGRAAARTPPAPDCQPDHHRGAATRLPARLSMGGAARQVGHSAAPFSSREARAHASAR